MGKIIKISNPASCARLEFIVQGNFSQPLPEGFTSADGVLIKRESRSLVCFWDGYTWHRLNSAGWHLNFASKFPDMIRIGTWAVIAPLPRPRHTPFGMTITPTEFVWAMRDPSEVEDFLQPSLEKTLTLPDQPISEEKIHV